MHSLRSRYFPLVSKIRIPTSLVLFALPLQKGKTTRIGVVFLWLTVIEQVITIVKRDRALAWCWFMWISVTPLLSNRHPILSSKTVTKTL